MQPCSVSNEPCHGLGSVLRRRRSSKPVLAMVTAVSAKAFARLAADFVRGIAATHRLQLSTRKAPLSPLQVALALRGGGGGAGAAGASGTAVGALSSIAAGALGACSLSRTLRILDLVGTAVFAFSGTVIAAGKGLDVFGCAVIAVISAVGGGTARDLLMGRLPVFWLLDMLYVKICIATSLLTFFIWPYVAASWRGARRASPPRQSEQPLGPSPLFRPSCLSWCRESSWMIRGWVEGRMEKAYALSQLL